MCRSIHSFSASITWRRFVLLLALGAVAGCRTEKLGLDEAGELFVAAQKAFDAGQPQAALESLNGSIAKRPEPWSYLLRAKVHLKMGNDDAARQDCDAGLQLEPEHTDLKWLKEQLAKPPAARRIEVPPSSRK